MVRVDTLAIVSNLRQTCQRCCRCSSKRGYLPDLARATWPRNERASPAVHGKATQIRGPNSTASAIVREVAACDRRPRWDSSKLDGLVATDKTANFASRRTDSGRGRSRCCFRETLLTIHKSSWIPSGNQRASSLPIPSGSGQSRQAPRVQFPFTHLTQTCSVRLPIQFLW